MASRFILPFADVGSGITPSSGAQLFFYDTGTTTPKDTYSDSAGTTPNANPVVANSVGLFSDIFISGSYSVVLKDNNGVQIWAADPVSAGGETLRAELIASNGSAIITHTQEGFDRNLETYLTRLAPTSVWNFFTEAEITDVSSRAETLNVKTAIATAVGTGVKQLYFPAGVYIVSENGGAACIRLKSNLRIVGEGIGITVIKRADNDINSSRIMYGTGVENITVTDLTLDGNRANQNPAYEQQHGFMVTWDAVNGSKNVWLSRVESKSTVGDGFFFHLRSEDCNMTDCVADDNLRVGANVGFVRGCTIQGCTFKNILTNGIKTEPNDPGNIARNITITGNTFSAAAPTGTLGGVTLGSPTTAEVNGITITGNTFYNLDFPVLFSKAVKNIVVTGNTMRSCRFMVRALSFTSGLGDIQENILVENNTGYDLSNTGQADNYLFTFYNAKNVVCRNNIVSEESGGTLARFGDFRECADVTFSGNRINGEGNFSGVIFLDCRRIYVEDNTIEMNSAADDMILVDNSGVALEYMRFNNNVFLGTYRYGLNLTAVSDSDVIDEGGNKYLGTITAERLGATTAKYNNLYESGNFSITSGAGAPSGAPLGDRGVYIREDGGTSTTLYIWEGAAWVAK